MNYPIADRVMILTHTFPIRASLPMAGVRKEQTMGTVPDRRRKKALLLGTLVFTVCFSVWGLLAGLMPILKKALALTATQASLLAHSSMVSPPQNGLKIVALIAQWIGK